MSSERRKKPRFSKYLTVTVAGIDLRTSNLSELGVQLTCPALRLRRLKQAIDTKQMGAVVHLPDGDTVRVQARVAYVSEYDDEYLIGADFETYDDDGHARWLGYIASAGEKR